MTCDGENKEHVTVVVSDLPEVRNARLYVRDCCERHGMSVEACDTAVLLTSEIVTNALTHGRSEARIIASFTAGAMHVEVADDNSRHPHPVSADENALDGRGLAIVDRLADAWGVRDDIYGKTVWFDVTRATN